MTDSEFAAWCDRLGLPEKAIDLVRKIRTSPPAFRVEGRHGNVCGSYPSRKMGMTIQFKNRTVEFPLVYRLENDPDVLEYYCQPSVPATLDYYGPAGKRVVLDYTAAYFAIWNLRAGWIEAKSAEKLEQLAISSPNRYRLSGDTWNCPPGEGYAQPFGLTYEVHSSNSITLEATRNAQFLDNYLRGPAHVPDDHVQLAHKLLAHYPAMTLELLLDKTGDKFDSDSIYQMIVNSIIHVDLESALLIEPERMRVFADRETLEQFKAGSAEERAITGGFAIRVGVSFSWDSKPWTILNVGQSSVGILGEDKLLVDLPVLAIEKLFKERRIRQIGDSAGPNDHPEVTRRLQVAGKKDFHIANKRYKSIAGYLDISKSKPTNPSNRTLRRHIAAYRAAVDVYGNGYIGLLPRTSQCERQQLDDDTRRAMLESIKDDFETPEQPSKSSSWSRFQANRLEANKPCPSYWTYCKAANDRPAYEQSVRRRGPRAAYTEKEFCWNLEQSTPPHGDRPFEICHVDHTELDLSMVAADVLIGMGRLWLTILSDAFSRRVLGHYLTFDEPSYRSCMMVIRECVRRHGRLPQILVVDNGPEFRSTYFDKVLAKFEITKERRPPAQSRFGSVPERLLGTTNTQFIHTLRGNTQIMKQVRQVSKAYNPSTRAIWDMGSLETRIGDFFYNVYDTNEHPALHGSPRDTYNSGFRFTGSRVHMLIAYDHEFQMQTAPSTRTGFVTVDSGRGVIINYFRYWCPEFRDPKLDKKKVDVRYDPFNLGIAWVYIHNRWVECRSQFYLTMKGRSEKELKLAANVLLAQNRRGGKRRMTTTAAALAEFFKHNKQHEEILLQHRRDEEGRRCREAKANRPTSARPSMKQNAPTDAIDCDPFTISFNDLKICGDL
jgi:transposase InsO family protein